MQDPASEIKDVVRILLKGKPHWWTSGKNWCFRAEQYTIESLHINQEASQSVKRLLTPALLRMPNSSIPSSPWGAGTILLLFQMISCRGMVSVRWNWTHCLQTLSKTLYWFHGKLGPIHGINHLLSNLVNKNMKTLNHLQLLVCRREIFDLYQYWYDANKNIEFVATKIGKSCWWTLLLPKMSCHNLIMIREYICFALSETLTMLLENSPICCCVQLSLSTKTDFA